MILFYLLNTLKGIKMGLKNLKVIYKINIISLITIILLGIVIFVLYNGMSKINNSFENSSSISNLDLTITKESYV